MREIKFRAWDRNDGMCNPFTLGNLQDHEEFTFGEEGDYLGYNEYGLEKEHRVVMQYTGLKDKNGKEIYEGDIVASSPRFSEIPYHGLHDSAVVVGMNDIDGSDDMGVDCIGYPYYWREMEVIGNIYENPELITK